MQSSTRQAQSAGRVGARQCGAVLLAGLLGFSSPAGPVASVRKSPRENGVQAIAFLRAGDLWFGAVDGRAPRPMTHGLDVEAFSSSQRGIVCRTANADLYLLEPPLWKPRRVASGYEGTPFLDLAGQRIFAGRPPQHADAGDGGLWKINLRNGRERRVLPVVDVDGNVHEHCLASPRGMRLVAWGGVTDTSWISVLDLAREREIRPVGTRGITGLRGVAWLDEENLLVAGAISFVPYPSRGGLRRISLRTGRIHPWLFSRRTAVEDVLRLPGGSRFLVTLTPTDAKGWEKPNAPLRTLFVDRRSRKVTAGPRLIRLDALLGCSADGRKLLYRSHGSLAGDERRPDDSEIRLLDFATGGDRLLVHGSDDACWLSAAPAVR